MNFPEFQTNVIQWATKLQIIQNSTAYHQGLKLLSEYGELCDAVAKKDPNGFIDGIGDMAVVAVIICAIERSEITLTTNHKQDFIDDTQQDLLYDVGMYAIESIDSIGSYISSSIPKSMDNLVHCLQGLAYVSKVKFNDCLSMAWNEIKDRTGRMNENGVFIKDA